MMLLAALLCLFSAGLLWRWGCVLPRRGVLYGLNVEGDTPCPACDRPYRPQDPHICVTELVDGSTVTTVIQPAGYEWKPVAQTTSTLVS